MIAELPTLWKPQVKAIDLATGALADGHKRICVCLPTGGGKSRIACELIRDWLHVGYKVSLYTNRKMLIEQLQGTLSDFGFDFGVRSAAAIEHGKMPNDLPLQVSSIQSEASRTLKKKVWQLHPADRIIIDEAHLQSGATGQKLMDLHLAQNPEAAYIGLTATPLDIWHMYDHLIIGATNSELRECGALVPAIYKAISEPDTSKVKKELWELSEGEISSIMNVQKIVGLVVDNYFEFNPNQKPSIGFAPGVPDSIWLCEQFENAGVPSAHIDGQTCVYRGKRYDSTPEIRREIMRNWKSGEIKIVWNRFVLREGIDAPFIEHMILATIFGSLQSALQSMGRGLRASPSTGKTHLTIQDHGGNWWRHGSVNANRHWEIGDTERIVQGTRQERMRKGIEPQPAVCPRCRDVLLTRKCRCGFEITQKSRPVIQLDGTLKDVGGDIFKPRVEKRKPNTEELWERMYHRSRVYKKGRTFRQAVALFKRENGYWPPKDLPCMPKKEKDWFRLVKDVPRGDLT